MKREKEKVIGSLINNNQDKKTLLDLIINKSYSTLEDIAKELEKKVKDKEISKTIQANYLSFVANNIIDTDLFKDNGSLKDIYSFLAGYEPSVILHLSLDLNYVFSTALLNNFDDKVLFNLLESNNDNSSIAFSILNRRIKEDKLSLSHFEETNIIRYFIESSLRGEKVCLAKLINNSEFIKIFETNNISILNILEWTEHLTQPRKSLIDTNKFKKTVNSNDIVKLASLLSKDEIKYAWKNALIKNRFINKNLRFDCLDKGTSEQILEDPETIKLLPLSAIEEFIEGYEDKVKLYRTKELIFIYLDRINKETLPTTHNIFGNITKFELKNLIQDEYFDYVKEPVVLYLIKSLSEKQISIIIDNPRLKDQILNIKDVKYYKYLPLHLQEEILSKRAVFKNKNDLAFFINSKDELISKTFNNNPKLYNEFINYITSDNDLTIDNILNIINNLPSTYYKKLIKEDLNKLNGKILLSLLSSNIDVARQGILKDKELCVKVLESVNPETEQDYLNCLSKLSNSEKINLITKDSNYDNIETLCLTINTLDDKYKQEIYNNKAIREKVIFASNKHYILDKYTIEYLMNNEQEINRLSAEKLCDLLLQVNISDSIKILKDKKTLEKIIKSSKKNETIKETILKNPSLLSYVITPDNMNFIPRDTLVSIINNLPITERKYMCSNEYILKVIFSDRVLKTYKNLLEKNNYLFNTLDFDFLNEDTINIKFNVLEYITQDKELQRLFINIKYYLPINYKFIFTVTNLVNEIDPRYLKDVLILLEESLSNKNRNKIGNFEKILKDVNLDNLTIKEYNKIINYLLFLIPKYNYSNAHVRKIAKELIPESFEELKKFERTYDDYYTKALDAADQKSYANNYLLRFFKISLDEAKFAINKYNLNGIDVSKNRDLIFIQKLDKIINNGEYSSKEDIYSIVDLFKKDRLIKQSYANIINYEINTSTNNLKFTEEKVNGQKVNIYNAKDKFTYLVSRFGVEAFEAADYLEEWSNYLSTKEEDYFETNLISNDNLSSTSKLEILFGFNTIDNDSIMHMAPYHINDNNDLFMCPRSIINNTRESHNNIYVSKYEQRPKYKTSNPYILPDNIIVYKNQLYDDNNEIKHSYLEIIAKISRDFANKNHPNGLSIIVIDREYIANNELTKLNNNIDKYMKNSNVRLYSKIIKKYLNNKSGYILSNSTLAYHFDNKLVTEPLKKRINESTSINELDSLRRLLIEEQRKSKKVKVNISYETIDFDEIFKLIDARKKELLDK